MTRRDRVIFALVGVLALFAFWRVSTRAWTCDDAFISFRYADNLVQGHGLVFNPGERVEGMTNFLFTIVLAAGSAAGITPPVASLVVGAFSYFAVAGILVAWSWRRRKRPSTWVPLGAALWLAQDDLHTWATGGLETTMFAACALGAMALLLVPAHPMRRHRISAGFLLAATCLVRPDGALFVPIALACPFLSRHRDRCVSKDLLEIALPVAVIGGAFVAWKLRYYGALLPTAFYVKAPGEHRYTQGLVYVGLYFAKNWSTTVAFVALALAVVLFRRRRAALRRDAIVALASFVVFTAYVAHSAGDYMFARRLVPALPFLFVFLDAALGLLGRRVIESNAAVVLAGALVPYPVLPDAPNARVHGIGDERRFYPEELVEMRREQAAIARDVFAPYSVPSAFGGGMCMFAYFSGLPNLIEPNGLTQAWAAKEAASSSTLVGHRRLPRELLVAHGVRLIFHNDQAPVSPAPTRYDELVVAGMLRVEIVQYDDALMEALARDPRVRFVRIDEVLKEAASDVRQMSCLDARATHDALGSYWLRAHPDADQRFRRVVDEVCAK